MVTRAGVTIQEFIDLVERHPDQHFDLTAEGEIIEVSPKLAHGRCQTRSARFLDVWMDLNPLPGFVVATEVAHEIHGWLCRPDVSITLDGEEIPTIAPLLAVEIKSDANTYSDLRAKARKYLELGTKMVWLVYPDKQLIEVYQADADDQILTADDSLDGGAVLPGFSVAVKALFE